MESAPSPSTPSKSGAAGGGAPLEGDAGALSGRRAAAQTGGWRQVAVLVPTTGSAPLVSSIEDSPSLKRCRISLDSDFRPMPITADFHEFADSVLSPRGLATSSTWLKLTAEVVTGRSWELPVAAACMLKGQGIALTTTVEEADALVFATGAADPDLTAAKPPEGVSRKIIEVADTLSRADAAAVPLIIVRGAMSDDDVAAITDAAGELVFVVKDLQALTTLSQGERKSDGAIASAPLVLGLSQRRMLISAVLALLVLAGVTGAIALAPSILTTKQSRGSDGDPMIRIDAFTTADQSTCEAELNAPGLLAVPYAPLAIENGQVEAHAGAFVCQLVIGSATGEAVEVYVSPSISGALIPPGSLSRASGPALLEGTVPINLPFWRVPDGGAGQIFARAPGGKFAPIQMQFGGRHD